MNVAGVYHEGNIDFKVEFVEVVVNNVLLVTNKLDQVVGQLVGDLMLLNNIDKRVPQIFVQQHQYLYHPIDLLLNKIWLRVLSNHFSCLFRLIHALFLFLLLLNCSLLINAALISLLCSREYKILPAIDRQNIEGLEDHNFL